MYVDASALEKPKRGPARPDIVSYYMPMLTIILPDKLLREVDLTPKSLHVSNKCLAGPGPGGNFGPEVMVWRGLKKEQVNAPEPEASHPSMHPSISVYLSIYLSIYRVGCSPARVGGCAGGSERSELSCGRVRWGVGPCCGACDSGAQGHASRLLSPRVVICHRYLL